MSIDQYEQFLCYACQPAHPEVRRIDTKTMRHCPLFRVSVDVSSNVWRRCLTAPQWAGSAVSEDTRLRDLLVTLHGKMAQEYFVGPELGFDFPIRNVAPDGSEALERLRAVLYAERTGEVRLTVYLPDESVPERVRVVYWRVQLIGLPAE